MHNRPQTKKQNTRVWAVPVLFELGTCFIWLWEHYIPLSSVSCPQSCDGSFRLVMPQMSSLIGRSIYKRKTLVCPCHIIPCSPSGYPVTLTLLPKDSVQEARPHSIPHPMAEMIPWGGKKGQVADKQVFCCQTLCVAEAGRCVLVALRSPVASPWCQVRAGSRGLVLRGAVAGLRNSSLCSRCATPSFRDRGRGFCTF